MERLEWLGSNWLAVFWCVRADGCLSMLGYGWARLSLAVFKLSKRHDQI
jgi:hypothetical protein